MPKSLNLPYRAWVSFYTSEGYRRVDVVTNAINLLDIDIN